MSVLGNQRRIKMLKAKRGKFLFVLLALAVSACGTTEKTTIVNPPAGSTVVVPPDGDPKVTKPNN
jgi:hypothetical protein